RNEKWVGKSASAAANHFSANTSRKKEKNGRSKLRPYGKSEPHEPLNTHFRPVLSEHPAQHPADLAERDIRFDTLDEQRHQVLAAARRRLQMRQQLADARIIPFGAQSRQPVALRLLDRRIDPQNIPRRAVLVIVCEAVDAYDDLLARLHGLLIRVRCVVDLALNE